MGVREPLASKGMAIGVADDGKEEVFLEELDLDDVSEASC